MSIYSAFDEFQKTIDADFELVRIARDRRDLFKAALGSASDVTSVWGAGSLSRSTQLQPIHDVDIVVEFDPKDHPTWGQPGASSDEAVERCRELVTDLLGVANGSVAQVVRQVTTAGRNRAAKCFIDPPTAEDPFTVDVMPALARPGGILIPSKANERWDPADPEYLRAAVAARQSDWQQFRPLVRVLKHWAKGQQLKVKSLTIEVLALEVLAEKPNKPAAIVDFFRQASMHTLQVDDPAGLCGAIQPDLDRWALRRAFEDSHSLAESAIRAVGDNNDAEASRLWRAVFGSDFPLIAAAGSSSAEPRTVKDSPQG